MVHLDYPWLGILLDIARLFTSATRKKSHFLKPSFKSDHAVN
uniref:Uncharacterized protein n=1 Tax=Anguilla anguilla TaxID=7936 RepID=A0A0E9SZI4_ANGAN